jgi:CHAD domain-containing protein
MADATRTGGDMAYRLEFNEPPAVGARRVASEQLEHAMSELRGGIAEDPVAAVHEARKSVKKSRAVLRLTRSCLPKGTYRRENRALREAGRSLSGTRDADVMLQTIDKLAERFSGHLPAKAFEDLREEVTSRRGAQAAETAEAPAEAISALSDIAARVDDWPLDDYTWSRVGRDATRAYARGRSEFKRAQRSGSAEDLHEWRKRVKDLWYHQRLLKQAWPGVLKAQAKQADALADALGEDHDLAVLADFLRRTGPELDTTTDLDAVAELIDRRRGELQTEARRLGRRLYADSPKAFESRLRTWLRASEAEDERARSTA